MYFGIKWILIFNLQVVKVTKDMSIGPAQLKCLPHDEPTKDLVEPVCNVSLPESFQSPQHVVSELPVSVLRLANNQVFQLGVFKPDRVGRLYPG